MPATSSAEQARADAYLDSLARRAAIKRAQAVSLRGDDDARRALGDKFVPLRKT